MTATLTLHAIGDELQAIAEALVENGGDLTPELAAQLAAIEGAFTSKVERVLLYARNLEATAEAAKQEAVRITALSTSREKAAARLREYVKTEMERADVAKVETPLIVARIQQNSRPSISWTLPIEELDKRFVKITYALDGTKAYEAWKANSTALPEGFVVERGTHLRVR